MRKPTQEEVEKWTRKAQEHGFADAEGNFALGRYVTEGSEHGEMSVVFVTPVPAGLRDEQLRPKTPPIMFDRLPDGRLILPGRWWQLAFEKLAEDERVPDDVRRTAFIAARQVVIGDAFLPADTDTIEILAADDAGILVPHEALMPGTRCRVKISRK